MTTSLRHTFGIGLLLLAGVARAATVTFDLSATSGTTTLPDGTTSPVLGYALAPATSVAAPGGPVLVVSEGDVVTVNLTNSLAGEVTALNFQGQAMVPDTAGVAAGATKAYNFTASSPGTFLYEAGLAEGAAHQAARGLHGALVVRPAGLPAQAYSSAETAFDDEAVLVLSELDPALNRSANPAAFDMRNFKPSHRLINGSAYPATSPIATTPGNRVLLRYVNGGQQQHSMALLGTQQVLVGKDGNFLTHFGKRVAETIAPGETLDAIVTIPATTSLGSKFALFDGSLMLVNGNTSGFGGMLTFLQAGNPGAGGPDVVGPVAQLVTVSAIVGGNVTLSAAISDAASGGSNVAAAEYRIDTGATATTMTATDGSFDSPQEAVNATVPVGGLSSGSHTLYVRGQDAAGNWGNWGATVLSIDTAGPTTYGLVANPATSSGSVNVALTGSASDAATGGSSIAGAEYFLDTPGATGSGVAMTVSPGAPSIAALTATVPAATVATLPEGSHPVHVHARDALGNWGPFPATPLALIVDRTGPAAPNPVAANPPATNGSTGFNSSTPAIRVTITATDALSTVAGAEAFVDTPGASGTGFQFAPSDGSWNGTTESAYGDIPLSHVNLLPTGTHTIYVHARDAAGNWGVNATTTLIVDRTAPTLSSITLSPTTAIVGETVTLTANGASDATSGIGGGQYWFDTATPPSFPSSFTGTTAAISSATGGVRTVYARIRDGAGNWSPVRSATLTVPSAVNDTRTLTANGAATQTNNLAAPGVLANDLPIGMSGRTATLATAPVRLTGTGAGTVTLACPAALGTAGPPVGGSTICTNGAYQTRLNGVGGNNPTRAASKRGTFQFTYTETLNGKTTPPATVSIIVN